jgi:hypothetical protein
MISVILKTSPPIDDAAVNLTLLTDLTGMLPPDILFDFVVSGVDIGPVRWLYVIVSHAVDCHGV